MVSRDIRSAARRLVLQGELFTVQLATVQFAKLSRIRAPDESRNPEEVQQRSARRSIAGGECFSIFPPALGLLITVARTRLPGEHVGLSHLSGIPEANRQV